MWKFYQPVNVVYGAGELVNIGKYLNEYHLERAFVVVDEFLARSGAVERLKAMADGMIVGVSSDVEPNPTLENVEDAAGKAKDADADCVIAFGGGSAMDCAKAAAVVLAEGCKASQLLDGHPIHKALPVIAIPTTAGTGSEVTAGAVLSDKKRGVKAAIFGPAIFPKLALVDPELTYTVPAKVTAATGLDVLAHAFDAMTSVKACPATDALALGAAKLAVKYLERRRLAAMTGRPGMGWPRQAQWPGWHFPRQEPQVPTPVPISSPPNTMCPMGRPAPLHWTAGF